MVKNHLLFPSQHIKIHSQKKPCHALIYEKDGLTRIDTDSILFYIIIRLILDNENELSVINELS